MLRDGVVEVACNAPASVILRAEQFLGDAPEIAQGLVLVRDIVPIYQDVVRKGVGSLNWFEQKFPVMNATFDLEGHAEANGPAIFGALAQSTCELGRESQGQCILGAIAAAAVGRAKDIHESTVEPFDPPYPVGAEGD